jgi:hypothetical protein
LTPELAALLGKELKRVHAVQRRAAQIIPWWFPHLDGIRRGRPRRGLTIKGSSRRGVP